MKVDPNAPQPRPQPPQHPKPPRREGFEGLLRRAHAAGQGVQGQEARARAGAPASKVDPNRGGQAETSFEEIAARRAFGFAELGVLDAGRATGSPAIRPPGPGVSATASAAQALLAASGATAPAARPPSPQLTTGPAADSETKLALSVASLASGVSARPAAASAFAEPPEMTLDLDLPRPDEAEGSAGAPAGDPIIDPPDGPGLAVHLAEDLAQVIVRAEDLTAEERDQLRRALDGLFKARGQSLAALTLNGAPLDGAPTFVSGGPHGARSH